MKAFKQLAAALVLSISLGIGIALAATNFSTFSSTRGSATQPLGSSDWIDVYQGGTTVHIAGNLFLTTNDTQTVTNKTISGTNNVLTVRASQDITGTLSLANGGLGITVGNSGGIPCFNTAGSIASSITLTANAPLIGGGAGACPGLGSTTGPGTLYLTGTGSYTNGHGVVVNASGQVVDSANAVFTNVAQTFTQQQIFGSTLGKATRTASGTTDTLDASNASTSDCGGTVLYTASTQITVTLPNNAKVPCVVALVQKSTGRIVPTAATGATGPLNSHGFTGSFNSPNSIIGVFADANSGGSSAEWLLTGDGQ